MSPLFFILYNESACSQNNEREVEEMEEVKKYNADPYCNYCFTLNGFENLVKLTMLTYKDGGHQMKNPDLPIRFFSGEQDPCAVNTKAFMQAVDFLKKQGLDCQITQCPKNLGYAGACKSL